jgi:hypothetical protein
VTSRQRGLIWKCLAVVGFIGFFFAFLEHEWLRWVLFAAFPIAVMFEKRPERPPDIEGWVRAHPLVKVWLAVCGIAIAAITYASVNSIVRFDELLGFRGMFGLLLVMLAPLVAAGVWETYKEYGDDDAT